MEEEQVKCIVFDTETTGLSRKDDRVIEIGAMEFNPATGQVGRNFHVYINPQKRLSPQIIQLTGINNGFLADKHLFAQVAQPFLNFIKGARLVAHNAPFDIGMLNAEFARLGIPELATHVKDIICTRSMARKANPGMKATLDYLCDLYQVDRSSRTFHGALVDCQLTAAVYPHLAAGVAQRQAEEKAKPARKRQPAKPRAVPVALAQPAPPATQGWLKTVCSWGRNWRGKSRTPV